MYSPSSGRSEMPSGEIAATVLFNKDQFSSTENNEELSLQLLSNCVYFTNCTILRERKLLPEEFFVPFPVYNDIFGYLVNQKNSEANRLSAKLNSIDAGIRSSKIHKVALLVEENLNTTPVETYIWSFVYNTPGSASAEIGYHGRKMTFTVKYYDMESTLQNFCKLYKDLQQIFKELRPLPPGLIPSLKVAYKGDPEFVDGYEPVNEFVDLENFKKLGAVSFPFNNGFCLMFASNYVRNPQAEAPEHDIAQQVYENHSAENSPMNVESTRRRTLGATENNDDTPHSVFDDSGLEDALLNGSMTCNRNVSRDEQQLILQSEVNEIVPQDRNFDLNIRPHFEAEVTPKRALPKKSKEKVFNSAVSKRRQRQLSSLKKGSKQSISLKTRKDTRTSYYDSESPEEDFDTVVQHKKKASRRLVPEEPKNTMNGKEKEENTLIETFEPMEVDEEPGVEPVEQITTIRYGRTEQLKNVQDEIHDDKSENSQSSQERENYGTVRSDLKNLNVHDEDEGNVSDLPDSPPETGIYGRVSSILKMHEEDEGNVSDDHLKAPHSNERYGRVTSINSLAEDTPRGRPDRIGRSGRAVNARTTRTSERIFN